MSKTGVHYLMKQVLGYSYMRAHKIPNKMTTVEKTREFYEAAYLQLYLEERGKRVIYVDEFHVSMKSNAIYN